MQYCKSIVSAILDRALRRTSSFLVFILLLTIATPAMAAKEEAKTTKNIEVK